VAMIMRAKGTTRVMGKHQDEYLNLPIRDEFHFVEGDPSLSYHTMTSVWELDAEELLRLAQGGKIELTVIGALMPSMQLDVTRSMHPPVKITVGAVIDEDKELEESRV